MGDHGRGRGTPSGHSDTKIVKVVGVSFVPTYPSNLHQLQALYDWQAQATHPSETLPNGIQVEPLSVVLRRNPANPYDANAVEVHIPALGDEGMIGHLAREHAAIIASMIDRGDILQAHVHRCRVLPSAPQNPGIDIAITRIKKDQP